MGNPIHPSIHSPTYPLTHPSIHPSMHPPIHSCSSLAILFNSEGQKLGIWQWTSYLGSKGPRGDLESCSLSADFDVDAGWVYIKSLRRTVVTCKGCLPMLSSPGLYYLSRSSFTLFLSGRTGEDAYKKVSQIWEGWLRDFYISSNLTLRMFHFRLFLYSLEKILSGSPMYRLPWVK